MTWILLLVVTIDGSYGKAVAMQSIPVASYIACTSAGAIARDDFHKADQKGKVSFSCLKVTEKS